MSWKLEGFYFLLSSVHFTSAMYYTIVLLCMYIVLELSTVGVLYVKIHFCIQSCGLGQAKPKPSCEWQLWLHPGFQWATAASGQAKARAFGPSWAGTSLTRGHCESCAFHPLLVWHQGVVAVGIIFICPVLCAL